MTPGSGRGVAASLRAVEGGPDLDPDAIADKRAFEQAIVVALKKLLQAFDPEMGSYEMKLEGEFPGTALHIEGRNVRTGLPGRWELPVWEIWREFNGTVHGTATVLYAQLSN